MIDLHTHVLPGLDDGTRDMQAALQLARESSKQGVEIVAATPHIRADYPAARPPEILRRMDLVQRALREAAIPVGLVAGGEIDLAWAADATEQELKLVSYNGAGRWLLVETPYGPLGPVFETLLDEVRLRGFNILLAHPERNPTFQMRPERLRALVDRGVFLQVTAASLASLRRRSRTRRLAASLVQEGLAHVIASDAHGPGERAGLVAGVQAASREHPTRAHWMVTAAPAAILAGERRFNSPPSESGAKRRWIRRLS